MFASQIDLRLIVTVLWVFFALFMGSQIGHGDWFLPMCVVIALGYLIICKCAGIYIETGFLALIIFGYLVGNRGFAQITPTSQLPLFPGELVLVISISILLLKTSFNKAFPFKCNVLGWLILIWVSYSGFRLLFDIKTWGITAIRDYAAVYYALFFFLAQAACRHEKSQRFIMHSFSLGFIFMGICYCLWRLYPHFFYYTLSFRNTPLIFYKDDLVSIYSAAASVFFYYKYTVNKNGLYFILIVAALGLVFLTLSRAALLGLAVVIIIFLISRCYGYIYVFFISSFIGISSLTIYQTTALDKPLHTTQAYGLYEHLSSLTDLSGSRVYKNPTSLHTGGNNRFRLVWWQALVAETIREHPVFGLGFGYNLANEFVRQYYPLAYKKQFPTRSPHNYLLTIFARTGFVGLLLFLFVLIVMVRQTRLLVKSFAESKYLSIQLTLQMMAWIVMISAIFQVVLENPMGAIPFWVILGMSQMSLYDSFPSNDSRTMVCID